MSYTVKPEEHELRKARQIVEEVLDTCTAVMEKEIDFEVSLGWLFPAPAADEPRGASGAAGDREFIYLEFNSGIDNWEDDLRHVAAYSYGRSLFAEQADYEVEFGWQELVMEAFALEFMDRLYEGSAQENLEWSREEIKEFWPRIKESLSEEGAWYEPDDPIWSAAYYIGQELLEENELEELSDLKRSDIIDAGDRIFQ